MRHPWQGLPSWRILDTDFGGGSPFFNTWIDWQNDTRRTRVLHYVGLCTTPVAAWQLAPASDSDPRLPALVQALAAQWHGLLPGFHRFVLAQGRVILTLCVGDTLALLRQQQFAADAVLHTISPHAGGNAVWLAKALARCCRRGTLLRLGGDVLAAAQGQVAALKSCGFTPSTAPDRRSDADLAEWRFDPSWVLKSSRPTELTSALPIERCAVIGAGLAGASVAAALARRGWQVEVFDAAATPAAGASGLPAGLVVPLVSSDDCSLSRLSRAGVRLMLQQARQLLVEGQDWSPCGVLERQVGGRPVLPAHWPPAGHAWSTHGHAAGADLADTASALWHPQAAWIKPAALVQAWLRQPGVTFTGSSHIASLRLQAGVWDLCDSAGTVLGQAERVVLANASGAADLLHTLAASDPAWAAPCRRLPTTHVMRGLLSWALHTDSPVPTQVFPPFAVNGSGSLMAQIPVEGGRAWLTGSSYQPASQPERTDAGNHAHNLDHLRQILPTLAQALTPVFASAALRTWKGQRCISADRMPQVGPLEAGGQPGLWLCVALGSRGLSFSVLCAELLAARMNAEPWPVAADLAQALHALRIKT